MCVSSLDTGNRAEQALTDLYIERLLFNFHALLLVTPEASHSAVGAVEMVLQCRRSGCSCQIPVRFCAVHLSGLRYWRLR